MLFLWILQLPRKLILKNLIIVYKCNDSLVDSRNLIREMYNWAVASNIFSLKNYPYTVIINLNSKSEDAVYNKYIPYYLIKRRGVYYLKLLKNNISLNIKWPAAIIKGVVLNQVNVVVRCSGCVLQSWNATDYFAFHYYCTVTLMSRYQLRGKRWKCFHILYCWTMITSHKFTSHQLFQRLLLLLLKWHAYFFVANTLALKVLHLLCTWSVCVCQSH